MTRDRRFITPHRATIFWGIAISTLPFLRAPEASGQGLEPSDGDRIVLLGSTFIEREQSEGYIETALLSAFPGRDVVVRNLGWSGDTPFAESRGVFDPPEVGFGRMIEYVTKLKPTSIAICYGHNAAFRGVAYVPKFIEGMEKLLDALEPAGAAIVLIAPPPFENPGPPMPDASDHNPVLEKIAEALEDLAAERGAAFVDLFHAYAHPIETDGGRRPITANGIHPVPFGYWWLARGLGMKLGLERVPRFRHVEVDPSGETRLHGTELKALEIDPAKGVRFTLRDEMLPFPPNPGDPRFRPVDIPAHSMLKVHGLPEGPHTLSIDGTAVHTASAAEWAEGVALDVEGVGPEIERAERLRQAIRKKNQLFFHRWRPQNDTYIYGFRKHEQGQNAKEIPQFDPLIEKAEEEIRKLSVPAEHVYEIAPAGKGGAK